MASNAQLLPAYLIVGPDELKRKQALARLKAHVDEAFAAFNLDEIQAGADLEPDTLITSLNTLPMGSDLRVVVVLDAEKLPKPVSEALIGYLADPNPSCTLALAATSLAKSTRLYKAVAKVGPKSVIECAAKSRRELAPYIQKLAAAHGVSINLDAASELAARVGESTVMLDRQVASLADLMGGQGIIGLSMVRANVARVVEVKPWEFLDRLSERNAHASLALYRLLDGSALGLLSLITGRIRELVCARSLAARGQARALASELGKQDWQVRNHGRWARAFGDGELEACLAHCLDAERALKSGSDPDTVMVQLIGFICQ